MGSCVGGQATKLMVAPLIIIIISYENGYGMGLSFSTALKHNLAWVLVRYVTESMEQLSLINMIAKLLMYKISWISINA